MEMISCNLKPIRLIKKTTPVLPRSLYTVITALIATAITSGCATAGRGSSSTVDFIPQSTESAVEISDENAVVFNIPVASDPKGSVRITAEGRKDMRIEEGQSEHLPTLHVRMEVTNRTGEVFWNMDARLQELNLGANHPNLRPAFVSSVQGGESENEALPVIRINQGETQVVDLFYLLPADVQAEDTQTLSLNWQISANGESMSESVSFRAAASQPAQVSIFPFGQPGPSTLPNRSPASTPNRPMPPIGIQPDWWMDPFSDLPPTWRDAVRR